MDVTGEPGVELTGLPAAEGERLRLGGGDRSLCGAVIPLVDEAERRMRSGVKRLADPGLAAAAGVPDASGEGDVIEDGGG
jgi:hypothetical protein